MSKILAVADIHIHDYPNRNPGNKYRLYQGSRTVADNIIKVGKREGCDYIVIAGDVIEKAVTRPYVQAEVKYFLDTIMAEFKDGFLLLGNHDQDNKSVDSVINDSCLGVMLPDNLHYSHQKIITIDNIVIGFNNWQPDFDLTWIKDKVDILFTHATICYSGETDLFKSQVLDESKFDLAICGDIHRKGQIGKYVSIGPAQRAKMSDSEETSGVVVDCLNKSWKWVDLDPDKKLMKFVYTTKLEEEGWHAEENTWYVHKQDSIGFGGVNGGVKVDPWSEISTLVNDAIIKSNLKNIHDIVLKTIGTNIDSNSVNFNFTLKHLHCENWRSIESLDIDLDDHDKIFVQGSNGSGKSSLLSAIRYSLCDVSDVTGVSSLKPFIQFGKKDCLTEITLLYQGDTYVIKRGTKEYGLTINNEPLKYNEKRAFEKDVRRRLPFISYIDAFFLDSTNNSFLGSMSSERKTEITSKFLKLDKIDTFNETAVLLSDQVRKEVQNYGVKVKECEKLLTYLNEKLSTITLPKLSKAQLIADKQVGIDMQKKNAAWNKYISDSARFQAQIDSLTEKLKELETKKLNFRDITIINSEINNLENNIKIKQEQLVSLGNVGIDLSYKQRELEKLRTEGNNAYKEAQSISVGKVCSHCGQVIQTTEAMKSHRDELMQKVDNIRPQVQKLNEEIGKLTEIFNNSKPEYDRVSQEISYFNSEITKRMTEKETMNSVNSEINKYQTYLEKAKSDLLSLGVVEKVELPEHFIETMAEIESGIASWTLFENNEKDRIEKEKEYQNYLNEYNRLSAVLSEFDSYIKLTGPTGIIFEEIMGKLASQFSNNRVKYEPIRKGKGSRERLDLVPKYNNSGNWIVYDLCSSGQRTLLDIDYISKIVDRLGLLVLDEFLKALDPEHTDVVVDILKDMDIGCLLLSSHMESITPFYNKSCILSLNDKGLTEILFK